MATSDKKVIRPVGHIYRVYLEHDWGTEKMLVTIRRRSVKEAGAEALRRAMRQGRTGVKVRDVIPCCYIAGRLVEKGRGRRKLRVQKGKTVGTRLPKARVSVRENRRRTFAAGRAI